jgi:PAS domain S-box-containing protein
VIHEKKPLLINDIPGAMSWLPPPVVWGKGKVPFSWLAVPMMMGERPIGVISVQTYAQRSYDEDDRALLSTVAEQVAVAVENARLYEALRLELEERKRTEKGLRESEEQFRNLADQSPNMIFINKGGKVVYANKQCETTGYTREEIYGPRFDFRDIMADEHREMVAQNFRRHMRGEEVAPYEYYLITRDGRRLDAILTTKLIHHAGEPAILGIITDITSRKRTERFLRSLNAAALAMAQALIPDEIFPAVVRELNALDFTCAVLIADTSRTRLSLCYAGGKRIGEKAVSRDCSHQDGGWLSIEEASKAVSTAVRERRTVHARFDAEGPDSAASLGIPPQWLAGRPGERVNIILSPLSVGEDVFGLLLVIGESLGTNDLPIIAAFAHQTAAAWRKTTLMKDLEHSLEELRRTQDLLLHAQKMEAIGRLAGGIAHDFNNVLTVISGFTSLLADSLQENTAALGDLAEIKAAIKRASALTGRLLAFSRRQILQPEVLDLNTVLSGCAKLLRPLIGEDIDLVLQPAEELGRIKADRYQIEQVVINLVVNARDAMPSGGSLVIESANLWLSGEEAAALSVSPGDFVTFTVRDTGVGMSEEIKRHIFEPFFTTKEDGKGTGLGLSTVYGIVKQTGGAISVQSEPDRGSVFTIYIPCVAEEWTAPPGDAGVEKAPEGTGTILLVEDDNTVRDLAGRILTRAGYTVLSASSGEEALDIASGEKTISLMVTDVVMPGMNGVALSQRIEELRPGLPILFMSGYTDEPSIHLGVPDGLPFITKPFQPNELLKKVAEVIPPKAGEKA